MAAPPTGDAAARMPPAALDAAEQNGRTRTPPAPKTYYFVAPVTAKPRSKTKPKAVHAGEPVDAEPPSEFSPVEGDRTAGVQEPDTDERGPHVDPLAALTHAGGTPPAEPAATATTGAPDETKAAAVAATDDGSPASASNPPAGATPSGPQPPQHRAAHSTLEFGKPASEGRGARRPLLALGPRIVETLRNINRRHFSVLRFGVYLRRLEAENDTEHRPAIVAAIRAAKADPTAPVPPPPDAAYCDKTGNFVPLVGEEIHERFIVLEALGSGSFGVVLRCFDQQRLELVAVKVLRADPRFTMQGRTEARILTDIAAAARPELFASVGRGPQIGTHLREAAADAARRLQEGRVVGADHVLKLRKAFEWRGHVCIVTELLGKSLYDLLRISNFQGVSLRLTAKFGVQVGRALRLLGTLNKPVVHVDVKPENILLVDDRRSAIKLVDFGSSCYENAPLKAQYAQSRFCRAPEVMLRLPYDCAVDTWSAATVLFEMHAGSPLFDGKSESIQLQKFQQVLGPMPPALVKKSRKVRLVRLVPQTQATEPTPLHPDVIAQLPSADRPRPASATTHEKWFEMLTYDEVAQIPGGSAEPDPNDLSHWDAVRPIPLAEAAARIKTELLRKRIANFRRAERRRGGDGNGQPPPEVPTQVDLFCILLARMMTVDPEKRVKVSEWVDDPALVAATADTVAANPAS